MKRAKRPCGQVWAVAAATVLAACLHPLSNYCADGSVCPEGAQCVSDVHTQLCVPVGCGNGHLDPGEHCDDGNNISGDGCPADCGPACGDGHLDPGETCDDGNNIDGDGCSADCQSTEVCGNGLLDPGEQCDDGNVESRDGCSSKCRLERAAWTTLDTWPDARANHAVAYDAVRGRVVMFGGTVVGGASNDTWEWDGAIWLSQAPSTQPPARADHAMAYDPVRKRTVMFGGGSAQEHSTWEWDSTNWTELIPHPSPPPQLRGVAMAFDPALHAVVVFGGLLGSEYQNQTWAWNGASWQQLVVTAAPPPRAWAAMAYDSRRGALVLFGGTAGGASLDDTWELSGSSWTQQTPAAAPPGRAHAAMTFDAGRGQIMLAGGDGDAGLLADAWGWDGAQWTALGAAGPSARQGLAMTYDAARDRVVMFGGEQLSLGAEAGLANDLWEWNGVSWRARTVRAQQPLPRSSPGLAYDPLRSALVLFGGRSAIGIDASDTWMWNGQVWVSQSAANPPPPRGNFALASDGQHLVVFGGLELIGQTSQPLADTWVLRDSQWVQQTTMAVPSARFAYAMAFDAARGRLVLFGGMIGSRSTIGDTWEWDGAQWLAQSPLHAPPARAGHAMAYDRMRGRVVLFGGSAGSGAPADADTWEWDGTDWAEQTPPISPPARTHHAMAYDPARGGVILFGGDAGGASSDTWLWNGTNWEQQAPAASPPARTGHAMAFDETAQRVVMFAGTNVAGAPLDDIWQWDGTNWQQMTPATGLPPARETAAMAYDAARTTTLLFGGAADDTSPLGDTWIWDGASWSAVAAGTAPPPRSGPAMAFDSARGRTVLFGGAGATGDLDDVWEWDGSAWLAASPTTRPPARHGHALVHDAARHTTLVIGGVGSGAMPQLSDLWAWDGTQWTDVTPDRVPPWRMDFAAAFDAARGRVVLFGGHTSSALLADLWEWDGAQWTDRTASAGASPPARFGHALTYDAGRHRVVLFGGQGSSGSLADAWEWDGTAWIQLSPDAAIAARRGHTMVYDEAHQSLIVFGGRDPQSGPSRTTSFLRYDDPQSPAEVCQTGFDTDGDGKTGCADPDCQSLCQRCGDGVCDPSESCQLCPADCGTCMVCGDLQCDSGESCTSCPGDCGVCDGT